MFQFGPWWWNISGSPISFFPLLVAISYGLLLYTFHGCPWLLGVFLCFFSGGVEEDLCFIMVSLLLSVLPQLSCYFPHFKVIALLLVQFCLGFPCFVVWWLCLATYTAACFLDSFPWIFLSPSTNVYVCLLNRKVLFVFPATFITLHWWACALLCSHHELDVSWVFLRKVGIAHSGPITF